jgi:hypothetical protein
MNSTVYINGHELGTRPYGYISFSYDLTPYIKWGVENVLAVRVDNAEQPNSRWYSGCGIYRNVWLTKLNPAHIAQWGTYVTAEDVSKNSAQLKIRTKLQYDAEAQMADVVLQSRLVDADGNAVGEAVSEAQLMPLTPAEVEQEIHLKNPRLSEMRRFFEKYYVASNMGLILSGDFDTEEVLPILESTFSRIRKGKPPHRDIVALPPFEGREKVSVGPRLSGTKPGREQCLPLRGKQPHERVCLQTVGARCAPTSARPAAFPQEVVCRTAAGRTCAAPTKQWFSLRFA